MFDHLLFIICELVILEARISEFEKESWQFWLCFHLSDFNDASHHSILRSTVLCELISINIPLIVVLQLKNRRYPHYVIERITPLLFHYINLVLLKALSWVIYDNLIRIFHVLYVIVNHREEMTLIKLNNIALLQALGVDLSGLIIQEKIPVVNNRPGIETFNYKLYSFKVNEDLNYSLFHHLNRIHLLTRLEYKSAWVVLSGSSCIYQIVKDYR